MWQRFFVIILLLITGAGCLPRVEQPQLPPSVQPQLPPPVQPPRNYTYEHPVTPQSDRSRAIIVRRTPFLVNVFEKKSFRLGAPIFIRIFKESHELELWVKREDSYALFKTYPIACFSGTLGPKLMEGDKQAPEGFYTVSPAQMNPNSMFHLSFNIGYPNRYDIAHHRTGSAIMVHGDIVSIGCFAMTDRTIEEIYTIADHALNAGQPFFPVHIYPFRMTAENLKHHAASPYIDFWRSLQPGYLFFEAQHRPPRVSVQGREYTCENE